MADLASAFYDFLPGSGNRMWTGHVTFRSIAEKCGLGDYWPNGSKLPAIRALLERTLEYRRDRFEQLVLEIVRNGLLYREKQGRPIDVGEIDSINGLIKEVGFKFPDLWDRDFRDALRVGAGQRAAQHAAQAASADRIGEAATSKRLKALADLEEDFLRLHAISDRQAAGIALEGILNQLFQIADLAPRAPFRVAGEQIDGSFELDAEAYLLEAKWEKSPACAADLYTFRAKIEGKSRFTRGVFVSINGVSDQALQAVAVGKEVMFFAIDGHDLLMLLKGHMGVPVFLRRRQRLLAEEGRVKVPFCDLDV